MAFYRGKSLGFLLFILLSVSIFAGRAYAYRAIQLDKAKIRVSMEAGTTKSGRLEVRNPFTQPQNVKVFIEDWVYSSADGDKKFFPPNTTSKSAAAWIDFSPAEFTVPALGKQYVNYIIRCPSDIHDGRYAILFFEAGTSNETASFKGTMASVPLKIRVGTLFYIDPAGETKRTVTLSNPMFQSEEDKTISVQVTLKNTGNIDVIAGGNFDVIDAKGNVFSRGQFNNRVYLLPGDEGSLKGNIKDPINPGTYDIVLTLDLGNTWDMDRGPLMVKEGQISVGPDGSIKSSGELH